MTRGKSICSCRGTCPACEAEVRYIQQQLDIRRQLGKAVAVVGISAGLAALNSCAIDNDSFAIPAASVENAVPRRLAGDIIEDLPEFPGGSKKLFEYLMENTHYPDEPELCAQGRVVVTFIVETDGSLSDVKVIRGIHPLFDEEAVRVVKSMPKWKPGKQNGEPVRVKYSVPVFFRLK